MTISSKITLFGSIIFFGLFFYLSFFSSALGSQAPIYSLVGALISLGWFIGKKRILKLIDFYNQENYNESSWLLFRLFVAYILIIFFPYVSDFSFTEPLSFLTFFPFLHSYLIDPGVQRWIYRIYVALVCLFLLNFKTKLVLPIITLLYLFNTAASMSYGRFGHATFLTAQLLIVLSIYLLITNSKKLKIGHCFFLIYTVTSLYYFQPFFAKFYHNPWFSWVNPTSLRLWTLTKIYDQYGYTGVLTMNTWQWLIINFPLLSIIGSAAALAVEGLGSLIVFIQSHLIKIGLLLGLMSLHIGIALIMDIQFSENIILLVGLIVVELFMLWSKLPKDNQLKNFLHKISN